MLKIMTIFALVLTAGTAQASARIDFKKPFKMALMCFSTGEQTSGMNKICFYDCAGSTAAITVSATSLCPLSINR